MKPKWRFSGSSVIALLILWAGQATAEDATAAIGRISYGETVKLGAAICTGVLVAPDLVLTARHCLESLQGTPATVRFAAGLADGLSAEAGQGAEVILSADPVATDRANDVALLRLKIPITAVAPLPLADPAFPCWVPRFSVIAYRRDAPERATRQDNCGLIARGRGVLALSCQVVSGNSGAPVLAWDGVDWQILGVMVAATSGRPGHALAAVVPSDLLVRIKEGLMH